MGASLSSFFVSYTLCFCCVFCVGLSFGAVGGLCFPKTRAAFRFSVSCVFLALALILYTVLVFRIHSLFWFFSLSRSHPYFFFIVFGVFILGLLLALFWKVVLPIFLVLYMAATVFSLFALRSLFGVQTRRVPVTVTERTISLRDESIELAADTEHALTVQFCYLNDMLILPLPRAWVSVSAVSEYAPGDSDVKRSIPLKDGEKNSFADSALNWLSGHILAVSQTKTLSVPIPKTSVYPSLYSLVFTVNGEDLSCAFVRDL